MSFGDAAYAVGRKNARRELILHEPGPLVPWKPRLNFVAFDADTA